MLAPADVVALLRDRPAARLLDVRTPAEFEAEHIAGAYNVPLDILAEHGAEIRAASPTRSCSSADPGSARAAPRRRSRAAGMSNLHVLEGGMTAWTAARPARAPRRTAACRSSARCASPPVRSPARVGCSRCFANPAFAAIPALLGVGLVVAGVTDSCLMGMLLASFRTTALQLRRAGDGARAGDGRARRDRRARRAPSSQLRALGRSVTLLGLSSRRRSASRSACSAAAARSSPCPSSCTCSAYEAKPAIAMSLSSWA